LKRRCLFIARQNNVITFLEGQNCKMFPFPHFYHTKKPKEGRDSAVSNQILALPTAPAVKISNF